MGADHPLTDAKALARTYDPQSYADPWDLVSDYQRVLEYTGRNPNAAPGYVARKLELPRSRIRPWIDDGAVPDPVRGIQAAETRGWIPLHESTTCFSALNRLLAWACAAGTIKPDIYTPFFRVERDVDRDNLESLLDVLDLEYGIHRTDDVRTTEYRIGSDGAVLGRVLSTLGAPVEGRPTEGRPAYLHGVSADAKRAFARTYLEVRGRYWEFADRWLLEHSNRSNAYRRSLARLFDSLGADADVHEDAVSIDAAFADDLLPTHAV